MTRFSLTAGKSYAVAQFLALFSYAHIDLVALEGFQRHRAIAEILEAQLIEIVASDIDVEILAPIVLHPLVDDAASRPRNS